MADKQYIIVGKNIGVKNPRAQYYCQPQGWVKFFWSFNDTHAVIVSGMQDARFAQQWAQNEHMGAVIVEYKPQIRQDQKQESSSFEDIVAKAQRLGCEVIY